MQYRHFAVKEGIWVETTRSTSEFASAARKGGRSPFVTDEETATRSCLSWQDVRAKLCDGAADLAEVLEHDAEQYRHSRGDIAVADPRLADRADKGHAFVLIDRRQGSIEASARG